MYEARVCLDFDGSGDYGRGADYADFDWEYTQAWTGSAWFKTTGTDGYFWSKMDSGLTGIGFGLSGGYLALIVGNSNTVRVRVATDATYNDGNWHLVTATYSGSGTAAGVTIYVDGVVVASTASEDTLASNTVRNTQVFNLGGRSNGSFLYTGKTHAIAVWNKALSADEVWGVWNLGNPSDLTNHPASANLQGFWKTGENWPYAVDLSGNLRHAYLEGMFESSDVIVDYPVALVGLQRRRQHLGTYFDGAGYVTMGNVLGFEYNQARTLSCWFKSTTTASEYLISKRDGSAVGYGLLLKGDLSGLVEFGLINTLTTAEATVRTTSTGWNDGGWHHVVAVSTGTGTVAGLLVYIDGNLQTTTTVADNLGAASILNTASFNLSGRTDGGSSLFNGTLDEAAFFTRALAALEVAELYGEGEPPLATETSFSDVLGGYWRCGDGDTYPTLTDRSTAGNDGTMTSMAATDIQAGVNPYQSQWSIRGYDDVVTNPPMYFGNNHNFEYTDSFSIAVWAAPFAGGILIGKQQNGSPYRGYVLGVTGKKVLTEINSTVGSNWIRRVSASDVFDGTWAHVVLTWTGSATPSAAGAKIYVNGSAVSLNTEQDSLSATIVSTARFSMFGRDGGWYCDAQIAEAMVYNTDLSAAQVTALYNSGTPIDPRVLDSSPNLLSWWPLGDFDIDKVSGRRLQGRTTVDVISGYDSTYSSADNYWENKAPAYGGAVDGVVGIPDLNYSAILHSKDGGLLEVGAGEMPSAPRLYYRMRGWNTTLGDWEIWFSEDEPDPTPPIGPCINVTATALWEYI